MELIISLTLFLITLVCAADGLNTRPIIGVMTQKSPAEFQKYGDTYLPANYVQYLESAGARVVPIRVKEPSSYYSELFNSINGVLFPGGGVSLFDSGYAEAGKQLYHMAMEANDKGDHFPLWGTCMGFQFLVSTTAGVPVMSSFDAEDLPLSLNFTPDAHGSRLFGGLPKDVSMYLQKENVTQNFHHYGLAPDTFKNSKSLTKFYRVLSTNRDRQGKQFISTVEAIKYPFYGVQWHPEKNIFQWNPQQNINHDYAAVRISQYMADFFVQEARKSNHKFPDLQKEIDAMIYNYCPVYSHDGTFYLDYYFNYTATAHPIVSSIQE